ncbi:hypothetical protein P7E30_05890 [Enterococcus gallinarum]|jgi:HD-GYP domain-containing protein (c-di-GMP phosphodiesterase class II)|uniref:Uncharacterized protein n=1 Tax=Enterococcus gallinarum TaxID=1353 RepID=A0AAE4HRU7_ENTGA|nr:hypothetical protein [Enterococcus gallinarum]MDT2687123.1 hypothetical protein [Enterococcus gallinarum]MDT2689729.1 hypothetical protein [Enterococcus gallinarum]
MTVEYTVTTPEVKELKEIDININELEKELDSLVEKRDKKASAKGKYSLETFKANKEANKDIEDLEKVIAEAYQERGEITNSIYLNYINQLKNETNRKEAALLSEAKELFDNKGFAEVTALLGTETTRLFQLNDQLIKSHNSSMKQLIDVLGIKNKNILDNVQREYYKGGWGYTSRLGSYFHDVKRSVSDYLDEIIRLNGMPNNKFEIKK